ncbi:MAG: periplasmic heavy metal sensor [Candidatus Eisenbacteria bacterium]|nr:periplasmic heavy metal sensor [Candidatus Eisenbacteria bacterium]
MRRGWYLLLALSLGLNAGLLYTTLSARDLPARHSEFDRAPGPGLPPMEGGGHPPGCPQAMSGALPGEPACAACAPMINDRLKNMESVLALNEAQREGMRKTLDEMLPRILAERDAVRKIRGSVQEEYSKSAIDAEAIRGLIAQLAASQARLDSLTAETILRESALLTREQRLEYFGSMPWERCPGCVPPEKTHGRRGER